MSENKRSIFIRFLGYAIPISLLLYVLSVGPVTAIICDSNGQIINREHAQLVGMFYMPLSYVIRSNAWLENLGVEYVDFWVKQF